MAKFEYLLLSGWPTQVDLNRYGAAGWELVAVQQGDSPLRADRLYLMREVPGLVGGVDDFTRDFPGPPR
jgi:hypothetical protein